MQILMNPEVTVRAAVLGSGGQLGRALSARLPGAVPLDLSDLDIADAAATANFSWSGFDLVINTAAYTAVDKAETPEGRVTAWRVNATGVANLVRAARDHHFTLVHVSSEYVFDGQAPGPVPEDAPYSPLSVYGASKAAGDVAMALCSSYYIVRTTWIIGDGANFVRTMLNLAARRVSPTVVADQIGRPTFAEDLASGIIALTTSGQAFGTYNITNTGDPASWADVARATFELAGRSPGDVTDTTTAAYSAGRPEFARRPLNSVLDLRKALDAGVHLPPWRDSLAAYVEKERSLR
jgi:dTDP-4-dehydrorhamnose reductase